MVGYFEKVRSRPTWEVTRAKVNGLLSNRGDADATEVVLTIAVNPARPGSRINQVSVTGGIKHEVITHGAVGPAAWMKSVRFAHFARHVVARITVDSMADGWPPGFPTVTSLTSAEEGNGTLLARHADDKGRQQWETFQPPQVTSGVGPNGVDSYLWSMLFWLGPPHPPVDVAFVMRADAELTESLIPPPEY